MSKLLLSKMFERAYPKGGIFLYISRSQGFEKINLALSIVSKIIRENSSELVFRHESMHAPVQFIKYPDVYQVLCEKHYPIVVREISTRRRVSKDIPVLIFMVRWWMVICHKLIPSE